MQASYIYHGRHYDIELHNLEADTLFCKRCGKGNARLCRIDAEGLLGGTDSYCLLCWIEEIKQPTYS